MSQFLTSVREVKRNYKVYDKWEQQQADEKAQKEYLARTLDLPKDKVELTEAKANAVIRATEMLDNRSENNCEDMELCTSAVALGASLPLAFLPLLGLGKIKSEKGQLILNAVSLLTMFAVNAGFIMWGTSKQKEASRIGRFQAKQNELKDFRNFVIYTPEQIDAAVKKAEELPEEKEQKSFFKSFSNIKEIFRDRDAYKAWQAQKDDGEIDRLKSKNYTAAQLEQAQADRELIVDTVKTINIKAEEYSENVENAYDTLGVFSFILAAPVAMGLNKLLKLCGGKVAKYSQLISWVSSFTASLSILSAGTYEQKEAARIGRFKARQELLKDPAALMSFTDEQKEQAKDVKAEKQKKSLFQKIGGSFSFLVQYIKDKQAYQIYKKKELKKNEQIMKILREETEISDAQMKDAKHLQEKVFLAFDEIDEMSQRYSEDVEAGTEIAKQAFGVVAGLAYAVGSGALAIAFISGKVPLDKIVKKFSDFTLDKNSSLRKLVNEGYEKLKSDKDLRKAFNGIYLDEKNSAALKKNQEFKHIYEGIKSELTSSDGLAAHFKKGAVAKWGRNLVTDCMKLAARAGIAKSGEKIPDELGFDRYKNYKTLWDTMAVLCAPLLGVVVATPYAFNAWLTDIQKKAGKIGVMKAMEKIDDPRVFVNENAAEPQPAPVDAQTNLLSKFRSA